MKRLEILIVVAGCLFPLTAKAQQQAVKDAKVYPIGALSDVERGELAATAAISKKDDIRFLFGLGPNDSLRGELTIMDGEIYLSQTDKDGKPVVVLADAVKAPYFVLAEVENWTASQLPQSIRTLEGLENYLQMAYHMSREPFVFVLDGRFPYLKYQIAAGDTASEKTFEIKDMAVKMVGFYAPSHQGVFTEKGSNVHIHFVSADKQYAGHVTGFEIGQESTIKLLLPFKPKDK